MEEAGRLPLFEEFINKSQKKNKIIVEALSKVDGVNLIDSQTIMFLQGSIKRGSKKEVEKIEKEFKAFLDSLGKEIVKYSKEDKETREIIAKVVNPKSKEAIKIAKDYEQSFEKRGFKKAFEDIFDDVDRIYKDFVMRYSSRWNKNMLQEYFKMLQDY